MRRVAVVGPGGAGKSTLARELGRRTGLPVVHLDEHFWKPGWVETPQAEWEALQAGLLGGNSWVADGNYGGTLDVRLGRADTVIVLCPPRISCLVSALRRTLRNRGASVQAPDCPERFDLGFLLWIWRYRKVSRPQLDSAIARHRNHLEVIELGSRRQAVRFLTSLVDRAAGGEGPDTVARHEGG